MNRVENTASNSFYIVATHSCPTDHVENTSSQLVHWCMLGICWPATSVLYSHYLATGLHATILSFHKCPGLPSGPFPSGFPIKTLYVFIFSPICVMCPAHLTLYDLIILIIWGVQVMKFHTVQFSAIFYWFILLRYKYSPPHPILKHLQSMFSLYAQRPNFTPTQNYRKNNKK
jgi:hypothetical protein